MFRISSSSLRVEEISKVSDERLLLLFVKNNCRKRPNSHCFLLPPVVIAVPIYGRLVLRFVEVFKSTVFQKGFQDSRRSPYTGDGDLLFSMEANTHLCSLVEEQGVPIPEAKGTFPRGISESFFGAGVMSSKSILFRPDFGENGTSSII